MEERPTVRPRTLRHEGPSEGHLHHAYDGGVGGYEPPPHDPTPEQCEGHVCDEHGPAHDHGPGCGHRLVAHAGHTDFVVAGHLHHPHGPHCDSHGALG